MALIFTLAACRVPWFAQREELVFGLVAEGGFLMMQGTLVDIATRLKKRPPIWVIAVIVIGVALFSREAMDVLRAAWSRGMVVFIPLLLSLAERGAILWHLPARPRVEKIAARALISNRITTGLALFALLTLAMLLGVMFHGAFETVNPSIVVLRRRCDLLRGGRVRRLARARPQIRRKSHRVVPLRSAGYDVSRAVIGRVRLEVDPSGRKIPRGNPPLFER